eukprot:1157984-Pelagomonas_calceolata.AAC.8
MKPEGSCPAAAGAVPAARATSFQPPPTPHLPAPCSRQRTAENLCAPTCCGPGVRWSQHLREPGMRDRALDGQGCQGWRCVAGSRRQVLLGVVLLVQAERWWQVMLVVQPQEHLKAGGPMHQGAVCAAACGNLCVSEGAVGCVDAGAAKRGLWGRRGLSVLGCTTALAAGREAGQDIRCPNSKGNGTGSSVGCAGMESRPGVPASAGKDTDANMGQNVAQHVRGRSKSVLHNIKHGPDMLNSASCCTAGLCTVFTACVFVLVGTDSPKLTPEQSEGQRIVVVPMNEPHQVRPNCHLTLFDQISAPLAPF